MGDGLNFVNFKKYNTAVSEIFLGLEHAQRHGDETKWTEFSKKFHDLFEKRAPQAKSLEFITDKDFFSNVENEFAEEMNANLIAKKGINK